MMKSFSPICLLLLVACGFHPVYEKPSPSGIDLASIQVAKVPGHVGQLFRAELEDELNPEGTPAEKKYEVRCTLGTQLLPLAIAPDGTVESFRVLYDSKMTIVDLATGQIIHGEPIKRSDRYNISANDFSTYTAEQDAIARGAQGLAHDYFVNVAAFIEHYHVKPPPEAASAAVSPPASELVLPASPLDTPNTAPLGPDASSIGTITAP